MATKDQPSEGYTPQEIRANYLEEKPFSTERTATNRPGLILRTCSATGTGWKS